LTAVAASSGASSAAGFFNDAGGMELFGSLGFARGGYTGDGSKHDIAGTVHKGEVIWSQEDVRRWGGPDRVDAMRRGEGYADGGIGGFMPRNGNVGMVSPTNNVIINEAPQGAKVERRRNSSGGEDFIVTFRKQVKDEVKGEMAGEIMNGEGLLGPISQRTGVSRSAGLIV
jgi:phage-related minor tail protein